MNNNQSQLKESKDLIKSSKPNKDKFENFSEIDIFSKKYGFDEEFVDKMLQKDCKWKEKKDAFDKFARLTNPSEIKSIKNTDRTYFIEMVKKLLKQPNINVIHSIINALNNLSLGLNSNFIEAKDLFTYLLNFLKEKKESIIISLISCLTNFSLNMNDIILNEKLINYCSGKPSLCNSAKINLCTFFEKLIEKKKNIELNSYINFIIQIAKNLDDPNSDVREKTARVLAYINYKQKDLITLMADSIKLEEKKRKKIDEYEKLYINLSTNNTANKKNPNVSSNKKSGNKNLNNLLVNNIDNNSSFKNNLFKHNNNDINIKKDNKLNPINSKKSENSFISDENYLSLIKDNLIDNKEEIIFYIQKKIQDLDNSLFNSVNWTERQEAFSILNKFLSDKINSQEINNSYEYYFKYILINNRLFKETNCLVLRESIICINTLLDKINDFSEKYYKILISLLIDRLNEKKVIREISNVIQKLADKISPDEIISVFLSYLKNKPNFILNEGIELVKNIIDNSTNNINNIFISNKTQSDYNEIAPIKNNYNFLSTQSKNRIYNNSDIIHYSVSKTPLVPTKKKISKYNYNVLDVLPPEESEMPSLIKNLYENDINSKILSVVEIKKIIIHSMEKNNINESIIKDILKAFNIQLYSIYTNIKSIKNNKDEIILLRYLLDDYILIANRKSLINNIIDIDIIQDSYETLFLLLSTKDFSNIRQGSEIINILNTIILCLLTNFNKTLTIITLINIISNYKNNTNNNIICSLAIKCLDKYRTILSGLKNKIDNNKIFVALYEFFRDFTDTNQNLEVHTDDEKNSLLMINSFIEEYINIYNSHIWDIYYKALNNDMLKFDKFLKRAIEVLLKDAKKNKLLDNINIYGFSEKSKKNEENENYDELIEDIMPYVNKLKNSVNTMSDEEQNNCYYAIVYSIRTNKVNISILSEKIDGNIYAKILGCYYGINSGKNSKDFSQICEAQSKSNSNNNIKIDDKKCLNIKINGNKSKKSPFKNIDKSIKDKKFKNNIKKNDAKNVKKKEKSDQSKRIMEYKNKIKYLTESSSKDRNENTIEKNNDENKQMNFNNTNDLGENNINQSNKINLSNNERSNQKKENNNEEYLNMKKKLAEIREKVK